MDQTEHMFANSHRALGRCEALPLRCVERPKLGKAQWTLQQFSVCETQGHRLPSSLRRSFDLLLRPHGEPSMAAMQRARSVSGDVDKVILQVRFGDALAAQAALPPHEREAIFDAYRAIGRTPGVLDGNQLEPPDTAQTVRVLDDGPPTIAQGPPDGTAPIDGYYILEADDVDTALAVAARIPAARLGGTVEVRALIAPR